MFSCIDRILNKETVQELNLKQSGSENVGILHKYLIIGITFCDTLGADVIFLIKFDCFFKEVFKIKSINCKFASSNNHLKLH